MSETAPRVFDFRDCREFLRATFEFTRRRRPAWSYGAWARQLKLSGASSLTMIVKGQRRLGPKLAARLADNLGLPPAERNYFFALVDVARVRQGTHLNFLLDERAFPRAPRTRSVERAPGESLPLSLRWEYLALRELMRAAPAAPLAELVPRLRYPVARPQAEEAFDALRAELATVGLPRAQAEVMSPDLIQAFHDAQSQLARQALVTVPRQERSFHLSTLSIPAAEIPRVMETLAKLQRSINAQSPGAGDADAQVYQLSIQFFPLTR